MNLTSVHYNRENVSMMLKCLYNYENVPMTVKIHQ